MVFDAAMNTVAAVQQADLEARGSRMNSGKKQAVILDEDAETTDTVEEEALASGSAALGRTSSQTPRRTSPRSGASSSSTYSGGRSSYRKSSSSSSSPSSSPRATGEDQQSFFERKTSGAIYGGYNNSTEDERTSAASTSTEINTITAISGTNDETAPGTVADDVASKMELLMQNQEAARHLQRQGAVLNDQLARDGLSPYAVNQGLKSYAETGNWTAFQQMHESGLLANFESRDRNGDGFLDQTEDDCAANADLNGDGRTSVVEAHTHCSTSAEGANGNDIGTSTAPVAPVPGVIATETGATAMLEIDTSQPPPTRESSTTSEDSFEDVLVETGKKDPDTGYEELVVQKAPRRSSSSLVPGRWSLSSLFCGNKCGTSPSQQHVEYTPDNDAPVERGVGYQQQEQPPRAGDKLNFDPL
ncbi:unnamed protein product [Amoebophrya sp. A120]|nr:unnamed protein product [Amoebophrya sp. A120]|eukprot:GSA120T00014801001.1